MKKTNPDQNRKKLLNSLLPIINNVQKYLRYSFFCLFKFCCLSLISLGFRVFRYIQRFLDPEYQTGPGSKSLVLKVHHSYITGRKAIRFHPVLYSQRGSVSGYFWLKRTQLAFFSYFTNKSGHTHVLSTEGHNRDRTN